MTVTRPFASPALLSFVAASLLIAPSASLAQGEAGPADVVTDGGSNAGATARSARDAGALPRPAATAPGRSDPVPDEPRTAIPLEGESDPALADDAGGEDEPLPFVSDDGIVRLFQAEVFEFLVPRGALSPTQRASAASTALRRAVQEKGPLEVKVGQEGEVAIVFLDERPVLEIGPDDAAAAHEVSAQVLAAKVAGQVRETVRAERSRSKALMTLLSLAFVVFLALVSLFLMQQLGGLTDKARAWILENPDRLPVLRFRSVDVVTPASLRSGLSVGLSAGKALGQIGIVYGWLLLTLSLFESTRAYAQRLTGFVFSPLYTLVGRLVGSLPLLVVAAVAVIGLVVLLRFVGLFFESVQRGETRFEWLPADLAAPTSVLVRAGVVLTFFVIAAPLAGGGDDGALSRAGTVALVTLGLSVTPLLASIAVGVTAIYGRRLRIGDFAELGGRAGRVTAVTLLEVRLRDELDKELRVPHLLALVQATRVLGASPPVTVEVTLASEAAARDDVLPLLKDAASAIGSDARASLIDFHVDGASYRVSIASSKADAKSRLAGALANALTKAGLPLGRPRAE